MFWRPTRKKIWYSRWLFEKFVFNSTSWALQPKDQILFLNFPRLSSSYESARIWYGFVVVVQFGKWQIHNYHVLFKLLNELFTLSIFFNHYFISLEWFPTKNWREPRQTVSIGSTAIYYGRVNIRHSENNLWLCMHYRGRALLH